MSDKSTSRKSSSTLRDKTEKSDFLCDFRFRNELPDPSAKPKLLPLNRDPDRYCKYRFTSLEKNWKPKLYVEPDLGIPLDLLDMRVYSRRRRKAIPLDPEDEALLRDDDIDPEMPVKKDGLKKKERPSDKGLSWLLKSHCISPLSMNSTKQYLTEKQAKDLPESRRQNLLEAYNNRERVIQGIMDSFQACKSQPVHKVNCELKPKRIIPLVPNFDRCDDQFLNANFVDAPTADSEIYKKVNAAGRLKDESRLEEDVYDENEDMSNSWDGNYHCDPLPKKAILKNKEFFPVPISVIVRSGFTVDETGFVVSKATGGSGTGSTA